MTEQHINTLKELLASSKKVENSAELDAKILAAARTKKTTVKNTRTNWLRFFPLRSLSTAVFSITICVGVLLAMSQIISIDNNQNSYVSVANGPSELVLEIFPSESTKPLILNGTSDRPESIKNPGLPPEFGGRTTQNQILAGLELPTAQALLEGKEFSFADERSLLESSLSGALADINQMLRSGALNDARDRYDRLRRSCSVCDLPSSLEALALANDNSTSRI